MKKIMRLWVLPALALCLFFFAPVAKAQITVIFDGQEWEYACDSIAKAELVNYPKASWWIGSNRIFVNVGQPNCDAPAVWDASRKALAESFAKKAKIACPVPADSQTPPAPPTPPVTTNVCDTCVFYLTVERNNNDRIVDVRTNVREALIEVSKKIDDCCSATGSQPEAEKPAAKKELRNEPNEEKNFVPAFGVNYFPTSNAIFANAGVDWRLTEKLTVNGSFAAGLRTPKQRHEMITDGVDVISTTYKYLGVSLGASYKIFDRVSAVASFTTWGKGAFATVGASYEVKKNVNVLAGVSLGKVNGITVGFNF